MKTVARFVLLVAFAAACRQYTVQMLWPEGKNEAGFKQDTYQCRAETRQGYIAIGDPLFVAGAAVSAHHSSSRLYNQCMEARGYEFVRVPRSEGRIAPRTTQPMRTYTPGEPPVAQEKQ